MKMTFISLLLLLLFNSCNDNDRFFDPTYSGDGFKGITFTLENDPTRIAGDMSDWCFSFPGINKENIELPFPTKFALYPAYPNPSVKGHSINIVFSLPVSAKAYLYIINKDFQIVKVIVNETLSAGNYKSEINTTEIGTGVYRVVYEADDFYCTGDIWIKSKK